MGVAVAIYKPQPTEPHQGSKERKKRPARTELRNRDQNTQVASLDDDDTLARFLAHPNQHGQPMLSRWGPFGRCWDHAPEEVEVIAVEVERALAAAEPGSATAKMLEQLLGLAKRAIAEDLNMMVLPD